MAKSEEEILRRAALMAAASTSYSAFIQYMFPGRTFPKFQLDFIDLLDQLEKRALVHPTTGEPVYNLLINMPPRHAKSHYGTILFPAYLMGRKATRKTMVSAYNSDLATDFGGETKSIVTNPRFKQVFPDFRLSTDSRASDTWKTKQRGAYYALGLNGTTSGRPANCFAAATLVLTPDGPRAISQLRAGDKVVSFDHSTNETVIKEIVATRSQMAEVLDYKLQTGVKLTSTSDHPLFDIKSRLYLPMREFAGGQYSSPIGLSRGQRAQQRPHLSALWGGVPRPLPQRSQDDVLKSVQRRPKRQARGDYETVQGVRQRVYRPTPRHQRSAVLHEGVLGRAQARHASASPRENVPGLQGAVSALQQACGDLLERMRAQAPFASHERAVQPTASQRRNAPEVRATLAPFGQGNQSARRPRVFPVSRAVPDPRCPPHRSDQVEQLRDESDFLVPPVPHHSASLGPLGPCMVTSASGRRREPVFDIQVADTANFFVGGFPTGGFAEPGAHPTYVLAHNCLIIDDPIKSRPDAESPTIRRNVWDFITGSLWMRLEPEEDGTPPIQLMTLTRWHPDDPAGRLMKLPEWAAGEWHHVYYQGLTELPTDPAEPEKRQYRALWPERFDVRYLLKQKSRSERDFAALYQQQPLIEGGNMLKRAWWQWLPEDFDPLLQRYHSLLIAADTAYKSGTRNDYSALAIGGITLKGDIHLLNMVRGKWQLPELKQRLIILNNRLRGRGLRAIIVEDHASGQSLVQELRRESGLSVIARRWPGDKVTHLSSVLPLVEGGRVFLPHKNSTNPNMHTEWLPDFLAEIEQFPAAAFDDQVDAFSLLVYELSRTSITAEMMEAQFADFQLASLAKKPIEQLEGLYGRSLAKQLDVTGRRGWGD